MQTGCDCRALGAIVRLPPAPSGCVAPAWRWDRPHSRRPWEAGQSGVDTGRQTAREAQRKEHPGRPWPPGDTVSLGPSSHWTQAAGLSNHPAGPELICLTRGLGTARCSAVTLKSAGLGSVQCYLGCTCLVPRGSLFKVESSPVLEILDKCSDHGLGP